MWNTVSSGVSTQVLQANTVLGYTPGTVTPTRLVMVIPTTAPVQVTLPPITTQFPLPPGQPAMNPGCGDEFQITIRNGLTAAGQTVTFIPAPAAPGYPQGDTIDAQSNSSPLPPGTATTVSGITLMANAATKTWYRIA